MKRRFFLQGLLCGLASGLCGAKWLARKPLPDPPVGDFVIRIDTEVGEFRGEVHQSGLVCARYDGQPMDGIREPGNRWTFRFCGPGATAKLVLRWTGPGCVDLEEAFVFCGATFPRAFHDYHLAAGKKPPADWPWYLPYGPMMVESRMLDGSPLV